MLSAIAIVPSAPVLVPELTGSAAAETAEIREAAIAAAATLPPRWLAVGVGPADRVDDPGAVGTFAGYGVDIRVGLSDGAVARAAPAALPLCALITAWLRGLAQPASTAQVRTYRSDHTRDAALAFGRALRAELDTGDDPVGVLVVADGANTLTAAAPGGYVPDSATRAGRARRCARRR